MPVFFLSCLVISVACSMVSGALLPIVSIDMSSGGFHRTLEYTIQFDYPLAGKDCEYYLDQKLPAAVFINTDQLDDLKRAKKLNAIYPPFVDVEVPTEQAKPLSVLLYGMPKVTDSILLPIHFRYHSPGTDSFVQVQIEIPKMYLRCPDNDLETTDFEELLQSDTSFCLRETEFTSNAIYSNKCDWKLIEFDAHLKHTLVASIPIGNINLLEIVVYITIAISWIGSICILFTNVSK